MCPQNFFKVEAFWSADCLPLSQSKVYNELKKKKDSQKDFQKDCKKDVQKDFQISRLATPGHFSPATPRLDWTD